MKTYTIQEIKQILSTIDFPEKNLTDLTAISILAMLDENPRSGLILGKKKLSEGVRTTDIIAFAATDLNRPFAENTRETIRKQSLKYLIDAGLAIANPDDPCRAVNSGNTHYILSNEFRDLILAYENPQLFNALKKRFINEALLQRKAVLKQHAKLTVPIQVPGTNEQISLSPGEHNLIEKYIIDELFKLECTNPLLVYLGDTKNKRTFVEQALCKELNLHIDDHAKLPDVIAFDRATKTVHIFEAVASCGPVDILRKKELDLLFKNCPYPLRMYSVFSTARMFQKYSTTIAPCTRVYILEQGTFIDYHPTFLNF